MTKRATYVRPRTPDGRPHEAGRTDPQGRKLCRWCSRPCPPPRYNWCSARCVAEYKQLCWSTVRDFVEHRDRGVCAICGLDTERVTRRLRELRGLAEAASKAAEKAGSWPLYRSLQEHHARISWIARRLKARGFDISEWRGAHDSLWEADHIRPVVDGGDNDPDNLRTLCQRCHKRVTAAFQKERAARRRGQLPIPEPDGPATMTGA